MSYYLNDDQYPYQAIVYIESRWGNDWYTGSGFLVGRNDVVTAAHVIHHAGYQRLADEIRIYPSWDPYDRSTQSYYTHEYAHFFDNYDPDADGRVWWGDRNWLTYSGSELDIAFLSLSDPLGDDYGWFGIDWDFNFSYAGEVAGFPGVTNTALYGDTGLIYQDSIDGFTNILDLDVNSGQSGGPVYYTASNGPYAVGTVSTGIAATSLGAHRHWLEEEITANDYLIANNETERPAVGEEPVLDVSETPRDYSAYVKAASDAGRYDFTWDNADHQSFFAIDLQALHTDLDASQTITVVGGDDRSWVRADEQTEMILFAPRSGFSGLQTFSYSFQDTGGATQTESIVVYVAGNWQQDDPVYRFYNTSSGSHFYTKSADERDSLIQSSTNMNYEGVAFYTMDDDNPLALPVYRFYNLSTNTHFFTASDEEKASIIDSALNMTYEGIAFYSNPTESESGTQLHRFYNVLTATHFYTASDAEKDSLVHGDNDMRYEGTSFWVDGV